MVGNPGEQGRGLLLVQSGASRPQQQLLFACERLAFLVAKSAIDEGHSVSLFLAGDAVQLLRDAVLDNLSGSGTGKLREHYDAIVTGGGRFYLSSMSGKARGVGEAEIQGKPAEFAMPNVLVHLALEHDRMFTY